MDYITAIKHGIHIRLYNAYKEFSEIDSTQLCNNTVISIVLVINHGYTVIKKSAID